MKKYRYISVLTIAGSDSGGGAGIQADLKTFSALGCFGASAITAITVQNTLGVTDIHSIPAAIAAGQIRAVMDDIKPSAIKIGMVHSAELVVTIAGVLRDYPHVPVILDPVMVATSGDRLIQSETIEVLKKELFPLATLVTPNLDEAEILSSMKVRSVDEMKLAGAKILDTGCHAVLIKGGHLQGEILYDVYLENDGYEQILKTDFIATSNTHGTGCTLSSAIASFTARGYDLSEAVQKASQYIHQAIAAGRDVKTGEGHGPLNHFFEPLALIKHELD
ncbi:hydroxymethylpyrimidine/phosphomethylpyrimidine kinase [Arcticibacter tournemirensis]|uniref:hydroxymethylpyrimidine kinase n=1 Tax=Arcticibacter tournemirensis TaxID=699437 RepID=A0A5M9H8W5_9SPHI|nr:bifunctional hydroxymethylpyrimidine kinase/phosphomethylpyrimidine kinase [Arcticibacter tournemirensis]KAA8483373.1 bifunctional hydroxymethylpyrimidine kinase/phosphomethylpyrimidine kinase [Arcticibacter tournemirensis]TQM50936.1 hydroxymethylpyrimidine/phosphomethylpyrimidine kinase [Arcticibacter tournemirensis]